MGLWMKAELFYNEIYYLQEMLTRCLTRWHTRDANAICNCSKLSPHWGCLWLPKAIALVKYQNCEYVEKTLFKYRLFGAKKNMSTCLHKQAITVFFAVNIFAFFDMSKMEAEVLMTNEAELIKMRVQAHWQKITHQSRRGKKNKMSSD